jgi:hypothetical protein
MQITWISQVTVLAHVPRGTWLYSAVWPGCCTFVLYWSRPVIIRIAKTSLPPGMPVRKFTHALYPNSEGRSTRRGSQLATVRSAWAGF